MGTEWQACPNWNLGSSGKADSHPMANGQVNHGGFKIFLLLLNYVYLMGTYVHMSMGACEGTGGHPLELEL